MYGHGYPQPTPPPSGVPVNVIVLRVVFAVLPLLSCGLLTWVTALRIGLLTRRVADWVLLAVSVAVVIAGIVLMPDDPDTTQADWAVGLVLVNAAAFTAYFLVVDIRHDRTGTRGQVPPPYNPYAATVPQQPGYGYPPQPQPQTQPQPQPQPQTQPQPRQVAPQQPPVASPRIDQVRAELDELSHLLRKDPREGGQ
ncbi:hypothetical protein [Streptomyces sp. NPDC056069]|uniref:hypothetical protein n=1 Tax=Streptomyces sp. NPDC056069 TaxID=3345702 RepID=UPI0035D5E860